MDPSLPRNPIIVDPRRPVDPPNQSPSHRAHSHAVRPPSIPYRRTSANTSGSRLSPCRGRDRAGHQQLRKTLRTDYLIILVLHWPELWGSSSASRSRGWLVVGKVIHQCVASSSASSANADNPNPLHHRENNLFLGRRLAVDSD